MLAAQWPEIRCWRIEARSGSVEAIVLMRQPVLSKLAPGWRERLVRGREPHASPQETSQSVKVLPLVTRGDPLGGAHVCPGSADEGEVLKAHVTNTRDKAAGLRFNRRR